MSLPPLHIVVPYRDRAEHRARFVPHLRAWFAERQPDIPYRVTFVEQAAGLPFNRGLIKNIGFVLGEGGSAYTCLHDIDYLPADADYGWADCPTCLLWSGAEARPVAPGLSDAVIRTDTASTLGGVLLMPNAVFRAVDGYSNLYWGWGSEDIDLSLRIRGRRIPTDRRRGTYLPLDHENDGFHPDATPSPAALANRRVFDRIWAAGRLPVGEGLTTLAYTVLAETPVSEAPGDGRWRVVRVRPDSRPNPEQLAAAVG